MNWTPIGTARTFLFVPGNQPARFAKALASGADIVIADLEDSVPASTKDAARGAVTAWLEQLPPAARARVVVRISGVGTPWHELDLAAVAPRCGAVMIAKAEGGAGMTAAAQRVPVLALVETAAGILNARAIASTLGVERLALGSLDLASELGVDPDDEEALRASRSALVLASAAEALPPPIDGVYRGISEEGGLGAEARAGRRLGFTAKLCIHPRQVPVVEAALRPTPDEISWARRILQSVHTTVAAGVATVDGQMVDKPVIDRAHAIVACVNDTALRHEEEASQ